MNKLLAWAGIGGMVLLGLQLMMRIIRAFYDGKLSGSILSSAALLFMYLIGFLVVALTIRHLHESSR